MYVETNKQKYEINKLKSKEHVYLSWLELD